MPLFHNALMRTLFMDHRQRDSIALTMRKAVMPWMRLALRGITHRPFDESFLSDPEATLYVLSPPEGSIAGAAVTLLEHLVKVWRAKTARKEMRYRLLYVIDEATNVAPMPALRRHVGEGRGLGVNFIVQIRSPRKRMHAGIDRAGRVQVQRIYLQEARRGLAAFGTGVSGDVVDDRGCGENDDRQGVS